MGKAELKVPGGKLIRARVQRSDETIAKLLITGDFFAYPEEVIEEIEQALLGARLDEREILRRIEGVINEREAILVGLTPEHIARVIVSAASR